MCRHFCQDGPEVCGLERVKSTRSVFGDAAGVARGLEISDGRLGPVGVDLVDGNEAKDLVEKIRHRVAEFGTGHRYSVADAAGRVVLVLGELGAEIHTDGVKVAEGAKSGGHALNDSTIGLTRIGCFLFFCGEDDLCDFARAVDSDPIVPVRRRRQVLVHADQIFDGVDLDDVKARIACGERQRQQACLGRHNQDTAGQGRNERRLAHAALTVDDNLGAFWPDGFRQLLDLHFSLLVRSCSARYKARQARKEKR